jgi:hypothetical protein
MAFNSTPYFNHCRLWGDQGEYFARRGKAACACGIYGEATIAKAQRLAEDGIDFLPIPSFPEDHN